MALTDKLTAIADAIRGKTGKADALTLEQMVTEIAGIEVGGGSGGAVVKGEFMVVEDITYYNLDTGMENFGHFLLYTNDNAQGFGKKSPLIYSAEVDESGGMTNHKYAATNNGGTALMAGTFFATGVEPVKNGCVVTFKNGTGGNTLGYFIAGNTYKWVVWE